MTLRLDKKFPRKDIKISIGQFLTIGKWRETEKEKESERGERIGKKGESEREEYLKGGKNWRGERIRKGARELKR